MEPEPEEVDYGIPVPVDPIEPDHVPRPPPGPVLREVSTQTDDPLPPPPAPPTRPRPPPRPGPPTPTTTAPATSTAMVVVPQTLDDIDDPPSASAASVDRLCRHLGRVLWRTGYLKPDPHTRADPERRRQWAQRQLIPFRASFQRLTARQVAKWRGVLAAIEAALPPPYDDEADAVFRDG
jgi:hypothetical protein